MMIYKLLIAFLLGAAAGIVIWEKARVNDPPTPDPIVVSNDSLFNFIAHTTFTGDVVGPYNITAQLDADWGGSGNGNYTEDAEIVIVDNDTCLRLYAHANSTTDSDFDVILNDKDGWEELYFSYDMKLRDGFIIHPPSLREKYYGGKFPGMSGFDATGATYPKANDRYGDYDLPSWYGFTARMGWLYNGPMKVYTYNQEGLQHNTVVDFTPATLTDSSGYLIYDNTEWFNVTERIVMNTAGVSDGVLNVYINGECKLSRNDVMWRGDSRVDIDMLRIQLHFGGSCPECTTVDEYIDLDNVSLFYYNEGAEETYPTIKVGRVANAVGENIPLPTPSRVSY